MEHRDAGIARASLIRQVPDETALHARLATVHTLAGVRRQVVRHRNRLRAEAADPTATEAARDAAARRAEDLQAQIEAVIDLLLETAPAQATESGLH